MRFKTAHRQGFTEKRKSVKTFKSVTFALVKYITIPFFCLLLVFKPLIPIADYLAHYNYYSKVLCVNKDKPMMHCNGKCQLSKKMAEETAAESNQATAEAGFVKLVEVDVFILNHRFAEIPKNISTDFKKANNHCLENLYSFLFSQTILKPPIDGLA